MDNLFTEIPEHLPAEWLQDLLVHRGLRIERIVSRGHASPPGHWYQQDWDEWVLLIQGKAELEYRDPPARRRLAPGDWLFIPAGTAHRVSWTTPEENSLWLALHWDAGTDARAPGNCLQTQAP
ncbi:Cupin 2 conserved barrel domain protein [Thioalkalivibrio sulfidiphilus HL-EbGr7]|uniref:Cupin 2 conserved barrel domain protein n=1 Tax=Thioalkalivibrio sulfidiphilus (strain HL-EbGR7) TaxID=396588 RepID=B8GLK9_THISH|nr:cupin domain-containing protein [Thioalkalivibrio sulfidiphilus]ACL73564.1 Cupin 2 conserved barrel domain protein [Thioalkalivibrio sulfidiphilus HL-EbGr7]